MIDVKRAARDSIARVSDTFNESLLFWQENNRREYLEELNIKIQSGELKGDKALIALGWIQAITYTCGYTSKETIDKINKES